MQSFGFTNYDCSQQRLIAHLFFCTMTVIYCLVVLITRFQFSGTPQKMIGIIKGSVLLFFVGHVFTNMLTGDHRCASHTRLWESLTSHPTCCKETNCAVMLTGHFVLHIQK